MKKRRIVTMVMILTIMVLALMACENTIPLGSESPSAYPAFTPSPLSTYSQEAAYAAAQSTLASGQSEMMNLSYQATTVSQNMAQAANAAAQTTLEYNQRQLMDLSYQATIVSQNMVQAAATQQFIAEQTQMVRNAMATVQSQAATATYSAYISNVTQMAYSLTATPWAAIQANIVRIRNDAERRARWEEFVVTPLKVILFSLVALLLIAGGVIAYRRLIPALELRLRTISHNNDSPLLLADGMIVDLYPPHRQLTQRELRLLEQPRLPSDATPQVEIVGPSEPSVTNWITEAEQKLHPDGRTQS